VSGTYLVSVGGVGDVGGLRWPTGVELRRVWRICALVDSAKLRQTPGVPLSDPELDVVLTSIGEGTAPSSLETDELDFKRQPESKGDAIKTLVDAAVCFANTRGGTIVMGIANSKVGPEAFLGCDLDPLTTQRRIYDLVDPPLMVGARTVERGGVPLLVIDVFQSFEIHADKQGRASHRVGTDCLPMTPQEHKRLREERLGVDWSAQPSDRSVDDIPARALDAARESLSRFPDDRQPLASLSDDDLLRSLGVVDQDGRLLRAGEVLLCDPPQQEAAVVYQYRPTPGGEASLVERIDQPLVLAFARTMDLVWARRNVTPLTLSNGQQLEISDFPEAAVREALSNALLHRDYRLSSPVNVEHSPTSFVVISPGPLVGSVTPSNILTHASSPRNPTLAKAARLLRLAEETGRGVDRMFREMIRIGHQPPVIDDGADYVRVVLSGGAPRSSIVRYVADLHADEREDTDAMLVLFTLCQQRTITAAQIAPVLQKGEAESESILKRLSQEHSGMTEATRETGSRRKGEYRLRASALKALGTAVRYHRRTVDEIDRKVISHLHEYGKITNRTLQNLFDIDVYRARDILADLQARELIIRTSEASRGPSVEYGPGLKLPKKRRRRPAEQATDDRQDSDTPPLF
jgi:ATP-dependent DNA helicase RecG